MKLWITEPGDAYEQEADRVAAQVMRMPAGEIGSQQSDETARPLIQRRAMGGTTGAVEGPPLVHDVLNSSGRPLDTATRAFFEPRLGHDFSRVRVHTDAKAAESARAVDALAYTVGQNVVFGTGQYTPGVHAGQRLLAHELTHVVQQSYENEPGDARRPAPVSVRVTQGTLQRQERKNPLDDTAKAIIAKAKDTSIDIDKRGVQLVKDIIAQYYPDKSALVDAVVFDEARAGSGLGTQSVGAGATTKGNIAVGTYFVNKVDAFARRVLQVGHELQHIDQYRSGLSGGHKQKKREFLAFHDEALAAEKPGTGRLSYSTRLAIVDAALGYFYCLSSDEQTAFESKKDALLKRREEVNGKGGNDRTDPPTACRTQ